MDLRLSQFVFMKNIFVFLMLISFSNNAFSQVENQAAPSLNIPKYYKELYQTLIDSGKVVLYAIEFDSLSKKILPQSEPQIREISKLLNTYKKLKLFIVVHTHKDLDLEKAITLSQKRAEAIRDELGDNYLSDINRIAAKGLGYFAPLTEQKTNQGKKINERVELVLQ